MLEETEGVSGGDRRDRLPQRVDQGLTRAGRGSPQEGLDLGEGLLDGVVIRRVGRQVEDLAALLASISSLTLSPLCAERLSITTT
jgi:hypothetical protein